MSSKFHAPLPVLQQERSTPATAQGTILCTSNVQAKKGITARIYEPDRDVFKERRTHSTEGIWRISPAQALLDCAGLGYAGRDITLKLTEVYDRL